MGDTEPRSYLIRGNFPPEQWDLILGALGGMGVSTELTLAVPADSWHARSDEGEAPALNPEVPPELRVNKNDFVAFADNSDGVHTRILAGRAWMQLSRLHDLRVNAKKYESYYWFRPEMASQSVLRYASAKGRGRETYYDDYADLDITSLKEMMDKVSEAGRLHGKDAGYAILHKNAGPKIVGFLNAFLHARLPLALEELSSAEDKLS